MFTSVLMPVLVGQLITIIGIVHDDPRRFNINLSSANSNNNDDGDIQLHISVRYDEKRIVRNSHTLGQGQDWDTSAEEIGANLLPFNNFSNSIKAGERFKLSIYVDTEAYFVIINDKPFCTYKHRRPLTDIKQVEIVGDVDVQAVNQITSLNSPWPVLLSSNFEVQTPRKFRPGDVIVISGVPRGDSEGEFVVNFEDLRDRRRMLLHFRQFMGPGSCLFDAQHGNLDWVRDDDEKWNFDCPFTMNEEFKIAIALTHGKFKVAVNGRQISEMPFNMIEKNVFSVMSGVKLTTLSGLKVDVKKIDFFSKNFDCNGYEQLSSL